MLIPTAVFPLVPSPNQTSLLIEGKIDLTFHKPELHRVITLPEFHEKDTGGEFQWFRPKDEQMTNEEAELNMDPKTHANAIN